MVDNSPQKLFQYGLLAVFIVAGLAGVFLLATYKGGGDDEGPPRGPVTIWGPAFPGGRMLNMIDDLRKEDPRFTAVSYIPKNPVTLYGELVEAIAVGRAPDLVVLDQASLLPLRNKLFPIPYEAYPLRTYRDTFVEGAELFAQPEGIYAFPFAVDPLVLFWNRDLFTYAAVAEVPKDWDTFVRLVPRLSVIENGADLTQGAIAFGEYNNVLHAKEIMSALFMQTDNKIVTQENGKYMTTLRGTELKAPSILALQFYTDFSNPVKQVYSWNKTFDRSREAFAANKVAMYAGFASEVQILPEINPNLNFDVSMWPQSVQTQRQVTYGKFYGFAILNSTVDKNRALEVALAFSDPIAVSRWANMTKLPTTRRDSLEASPDDPFADVLVRSAIIARSWLEPLAGAPVNDVFAQMINDVVSGKRTTSQALYTANDDLQTLLMVYN